jgi:hypothetical protein
MNANACKACAGEVAWAKAENPRDEDQPEEPPVSPRSFMAQILRHESWTLDRIASMIDYHVAPR